MSAAAPRVRFAPSPTGYLHIGGLRTALYNYLFAKKRGGVFVLRVEDTDQKRVVENAVERLTQVLEKMGLEANEGIVREGGTVREKGLHGPYRQSYRLELYRKHVQRLIRNQQAYYCFCSPERLAALREAQSKNKQAPKYDKHCLGLSAGEQEKRLASGAPSVIRLHVAEERGEIGFEDLVRGRVSIRAKDIDDQILMKSDGFPTYHLANVIDDHLMAITHVIRGEEWLPSTPKHVLLYEAFGWRMPQFAHLPLLLNQDKSKLSKRQSDVAVEDYLKQGYLPEALLNFVVLLGWHPGQGKTQEIFTLPELTETFSLAQVHKSGAVFDLQKLEWMNREYIKSLSVDTLYGRIAAGHFFEQEIIKNAPQVMQTKAYLKRVLSVEQGRLTKLSDIGTTHTFFFIRKPAYAPSLLRWKQNPPAMTKASLQKARELLSVLPTAVWSEQATLEKTLLDAAGDKRGDFLWPLRVALTGARHSPSPAEIAWVLGRDITLERLNQAIKIIDEEGHSDMLY